MATNTPVGYYMIFRLAAGRDSKGPSRKGNKVTKQSPHNKFD